MINNEIIKRKWLELSDVISAGKFMHYSFDFWNTIAFSNSRFKEERADFIHNYFDLKYSKELINEAFVKVGREYNLALENNESTITINDLYLKALEHISGNKDFDLEFIKSSIFNSFLKYPPSLSENFINILKENSCKNLSLSITSNTAFIPGFIIEKFLNQTGILKNFSFCVFSDDVQIAKPNKRIFELILNKLDTKTITAIEILHIGDNYKADYLGAKHSGLSAFYMDVNSFLINSRHALHVIKDVESIPFSSIEYSKFKFGNCNIAQKYGMELFNYFRNTLLPELVVKHNCFLIFSSPYAQIPTSSYYLTQAFYLAFSDYLNKSQIKNKKVKFCKIKRCQTYTEDYGALCAEARFNLIKNDTYEFVDIPTLDDVCIFIDDISITGSHQRVIEKLLDDSLIETSSVFLYYAKLSNPEICPSFENDLNYSFISDVLKLTDLILSDSYKVTTRTTKYILSMLAKDLEYLIGKIKQHKKHSILNELVEMSHSNEYDKIERYKQNLNTLKQCVL